MKVLPIYRPVISPLHSFFALIGYNRRSLTLQGGEIFFEAKGLRHCLIERLLDDEIYVSNDLSLKDEHRGILLYGTNAVGKTSFIN